MQARQPGQRRGLFPTVGEAEDDVPIRQIRRSPRLPRTQIVMSRRDPVGKVWPAVQQISPKQKDPLVRFEFADVLLGEAVSNAARILRHPSRPEVQVSSRAAGYGPFGRPVGSHRQYRALGGMSVHAITEPQHHLRPAGVGYSMVQRLAEGSLLIAEVRVHDRRQSVELTLDRLQVRATRAGGGLSELGHSRQDRRDRVVVLDELRDGPRKVRAFAQQLNEQPGVLTPVVRR